MRHHKEVPNVLGIPAEEKMLLYGGKINTFADFVHEHSVRPQNAKTKGLKMSQTPYPSVGAIIISH